MFGTSTKIVAFGSQMGLILGKAFCNDISRALETLE
jgi:hypothetical protein